MKRVKVLLLVFVMAVVIFSGCDLFKSAPDESSADPEFNDQTQYSSTDSSSGGEYSNNTGTSSIVGKWTAVMDLSGIITEYYGESFSGYDLDDKYDMDLNYINDNYTDIYNARYKGKVIFEFFEDGRYTFSMDRSVADESVKTWNKSFTDAFISAYKKTASANGISFEQAKETFLAKNGISLEQSVAKDTEGIMFFEYLAEMLEDDTNGMDMRYRTDNTSLYLYDENYADMESRILISVSQDSFVMLSEYDDDPYDDDDYKGDDTEYPITWERVK